MKLTYTFIVNPAAGLRKHLSQIAEIESFYNSRDISYDIVLTKAPGDAIEQARRARADVVVAVGGDGTVNEVVNGIIGSTKILGIIPNGTGNDFAHQLGYTRDIRKNLSILTGGRTRKIDVGCYNDERYFINVFSIGFDAEVARKAKQFTSYISGLPAYSLAVFSVLPKFTAQRISFRMDEGERETEVSDNCFLLAITNGTTYGGGFHVTPSAKIDDGVFTICFVERVSKIYALRHLYSFMRGTHIGLPEVRTYTAESVSINKQDATHLQLDGEILEHTGDITVVIKTHAVSAFAG